MSEAFKETHLSLPTRGESRLGLTSFVPDANPVAVVTVHGATGVPARVYGRFARFLARERLVVITYDYAGVARSRRGHPRDCGASIGSWGYEDADAVLDFASTTWPHLPQTAVGHSIGGFLLGLTPQAAKLKRVVTVGAQTAFPGDFAFPAGLPMAALYHGVMPMLTWAVGYFPASRLGLGEDLPAGVARQWAERLWRRDVVPTIPPQHLWFDALVAHVLAWQVVDDRFATQRAVTRLHNLFTHADVTLRSLAPAEAKRRRLGHLGFFGGQEAHLGWRKSSEFLRGVEGCV
jgi:predicted alpha/beta hydrolase